MTAPDARQRGDYGADYLRLLLRRSGLTQAQAAARVGISTRTLARYLAGEQACPYAVEYCLERLIIPLPDE